MLRRLWLWLKGLEWVNARVEVRDASLMLMLKLKVNMFLAWAKAHSRSRLTHWSLAGFEAAFAGEMYSMQSEVYADSSMCRG